MSQTREQQDAPDPVEVAEAAEIVEGQQHPNNGLVAVQEETKDNTNDPKVRRIRPKRAQQEVEVESDDSGDHTSDLEVETEEDSVGSLIDFVVDDDEECEAVEEHGTPGSEEEEVKQETVTLVVSAVFENGVRRSTRQRKEVVRYVDSDYEELMCADAKPDVECESSEYEEEGDEEEETASEGDLETTETVTDSDN